MLESLLKKLKNRPTCPITYPQQGAVSFVRNERYLSIGMEINDTNITVLAPKNLEGKYKIPDNIEVIYIDDPEYIFALHHNSVNKDIIIPEPTIGANCKIHETVVLNVEGLKVVIAPDKSKVQFTHTGSLIIEDNVEMGPYCVIHRGTMGPTIIKQGVKMGANTNIAHNNIIGENTVFAVGAITNGSVVIGKNCWVSSGVLIRNDTHICDNVVLGLGTVVVKNIIESGIYVGNPARKIKDYREDWNF